MLMLLVLMLKLELVEELEVEERGHEGWEGRGGHTAGSVGHWGLGVGPGGLGEGPGRLGEGPVLETVGGEGVVKVFGVFESAVLGEDKVHSEG